MIDNGKSRICATCNEPFIARYHKQKYCSKICAKWDWSTLGTESKSKIKKQIIVELCKVYGYRCWYCGYRFKNDGEIHIDHIKPKNSDGKNELENFALSCHFCNYGKFTFTVEQFLSYLAFIRSGEFQCSIMDTLDLSPSISDKLRKSFY